MNCYFPIYSLWLWIRNQLEMSNRNVRNNLHYSASTFVQRTFSINILFMTLEWDFINGREDENGKLKDDCFGSIQHSVFQHWYEEDVFTHSFDHNSNSTSTHTRRYVMPFNRKLSFSSLQIFISKLGYLL